MNPEIVGLLLLEVAQDSFVAIIGLMTAFMVMYLMMVFAVKAIS